MIVCAGSIALDTTHTPFKSAKRIMGGSASYFGVSASFFTKTALVSAVGSDFPEDYWRALAKHCDLTGVEKAKGKTFFFESKFDFDLRNRTALKVVEGVLPQARWAVPEYLQNPDVLFLNSHHPAVDAKVMKQTRPTMVFGDTIEYLTRKQKPLLLEFLKKTDGYVLNEVEARILSGASNLIKAGKKLQEKGPEIVVVKKGEHGGLLFYNREVFPFPAFPLENIVDPTGAGDAFAGGFLGWLDRQKKTSEATLRQACYYGTVMASFCVEAFGLNNLLVLDEKKIARRLTEYQRLAVCAI
ncbi:MAG: PfkB family carbohydrate kinase [Candidatus Norongarragalinales archaeon]